MATTIKNSNLFCLNCGEEKVLVYPSPVDEMTKIMAKFDKDHKDCKPVWKQPKVDMSLPIEERMDFWLTKGWRGTSSETMFQVISGKLILKHRMSHPCDPDDFSRCYKLLEIIPEWKKELHKMKVISPVWSNLVDNWDKLNEFYEDMRVVKKANGMFEFMKELGAN